MCNVKTTVLGRVIEKVQRQISNAEQAQSDAATESKAHKGAMESRYDTFREEHQYLAGGYARSLRDLRTTLGALVSIRDNPPAIAAGSLYAIVEVENLEDGSRTKYFLLPAGGGDVYEVCGDLITVATIGAPLARTFIGVMEGDDVMVVIQHKAKHFSVISVT